MTGTTNEAAILTTEELVSRVREAIGGHINASLPDPVAQIIFTACAAASIGYAESGCCSELYRQIIEATEVKP